MSNRRSRLVICCLLAVTGVAFGPRRAAATQKWGPVQLSGNLQTQNLIRHPNESTFEYIQNRNTAHIRLDYDWLQGGVFYNKYNIPFLESSHLFMLWRGVYDSIYDTTPGFFEKEDAHGKAYPGLKPGQFVSFFDYANKVGIPNATGSRTILTKKDLSISALSHGQRDIFKFDNQLREAYADIKFRNLPLSGRINAMGTSSDGKWTNASAGLSHPVRRSIPPAPRNMPMATSMATRYGMMRTAT